MRGRIEALAATLENLGADALLITSETNRLYYSGFNSSSGLIFAAKNGCCFMTDFRYGEAAKAKIKHMDVQIYKNRSESLKALIAEAGAKKIAIEAEKTSLSELAALQRSFPECKFITDNGLDKAIAAQRIIKSADELSKIKRAQEISEQAFLNALNHVRAGVTERDLALELEFYMRRNGASSVAFDLIVVSGENSSLPHGVPGGRALRNGDFITFDIGAVFEGYHSDMTRTVALGSVSDTQAEVYETVLTAQTTALNRVRAGVAASEIDLTARDIISKAGYGEHFGHSTGHGVGLDIHESPIISAKSEDILKAGMVVTVEPGIYLPNQFGVRIEDMVLVTDSGFENFATIDKRLTIV